MADREGVRIFQADIIYHLFDRWARQTQNKGKAWTNELIDTNHKCRLFFEIYLQENFPALICLAADEFCQPFSLGGNLYVDSGSWFKTNVYKLRSKIANGSYILLSLY